MKGFVMLATLYLSISYVNGQTCPKGFTEQYGYNTVGGGVVQDFKPSLIIRACVQDKSGSAGEQVFWNVKGLLHSYKTVRFIKHIKLTCGNVIDKKVVLYDLKKDESVGGGSFSGDIDLSDNIFKEDCANAKRIALVWADNFTCELADDDPLMIQEKNRRDQAKESSKASKTSSTTSGSSVRTTASRPSSGTSSTTSNSSSSKGGTSGDGGRYAVAVTPTRTTQIYNNLNREMQNNQDTYQAVTGGLQQLGALWQASRERKQAEQEAASEARAQREAEEKERRAERDRLEAERQAEIAEENRVKAIAAKREIDRQWNIDVQVLGNYLIRKKTSEIPVNLKIVYYMIYERSYKNNSVKLKTYTLNKYSDDTWMLQADLLNKVQFAPYINSNGVGEFLGFYTGKQQVLEAITKIRNSVANITVDSSFLQLNGMDATKKDKDFWNN